MPIWKLRKTSFNKSLAAYRSQWKRSLRRLFIPGYGKRGMGWWRDPKRAHYNFWYHRRTIGMKQVWRSGPMHQSVSLFVIVLGTLCNIIALPADVMQAAVFAGKVRKMRKTRVERSNTSKPRASAFTPDRTVQRAPHTERSTVSSSPSPSRAYTTSQSTSARAMNSTPMRNSANETEVAPVSPPAPNTPEPIAKASPKPRAVGGTSYSRPPAAPCAPSVAPEPAVRIVPPPPEQRTEEVPGVRGENAPKSKPKSIADRYSQKRLIIAGSS